MANFNIVYTSKNDDDYLWNGSSFDLMKKQENEKLLYSGKSYPKKDLPQALQKAGEAVKQAFPGDIDPSIKQVEIPVSPDSAGEGHSPHMPS